MNITTKLLTREERGKNIPARDIFQFNPESFWVKSQSSPHGGYSVTNFGGKWECDCPDYRFRQMPCKHVYAVEAALKPKPKLILSVWEAPQ